MGNSPAAAICRPFFRPDTAGDEECSLSFMLKCLKPFPRHRHHHQHHHQPADHTLLLIFLQPRSVPLFDCSRFQHFRCLLKQAVFFLYFSFFTLIFR